MDIAVDCVGIIILLLMVFNFGAQDIKKQETDDILLYGDAVCKYRVADY